MKQKTLWMILGFFILIGLAGLIGLLSINSRFTDQELISFTDPAGDPLLGTYLPGSQPKGVLLLEGFGSDQIALRPAATVFRMAGAHVFSFDFSGHGRSPGALGFDNAATDRLAKQVIAAKDKFTSLSGLNSKEIIYLGHSLGARVALQSATMDLDPPDALVLLGAQVNLGANRQSEFFTGTSDFDLTWVKNLSASNPASDILLLSGSWDDILTPDAAEALENKLNTESDGPSYIRKHTLIPALLHNYEIYSIRLFKEMAAQLEDLNKLNFPAMPSFTGFYVLGGLALMGLFGALIAAPPTFKHDKTLPRPTPQTVRILRLGAYLRGKLLLWLPATLVGALLMGLFFLMPLDLPVLNMYYVGFIGGYGLLMLLLYLLGKVPGTEGKWNLKDSKSRAKTHGHRADTWIGLGIWGLILLAGIIFTRAGLFYVIAPNQRLVWLAIFSPFTALGFWIATREAEMLAVFRHESGRKLPWAPLALSLIGLTPFFIYAIFMGVLGSLSGMVGALQGLIILALCLLTGSLLKFFIRSPWAVALLQAVLLYTLIMPQNVLFAF